MKWKPPPPSLQKARAIDDVLKGKPRNKIGRNDQCPCGSGLKYKKCCLKYSRTLVERGPGQAIAQPGCPVIAFFWLGRGIFVNSSFIRAIRS